jgi:hypothetical protein
LSKRDLDIQEILSRPKEDDKVTKRILARVKVVDRLDIKALRSSDVLEDFPVCACWPRELLESARKYHRVCLRALEQCDEEAGDV